MGILKVAQQHDYDKVLSGYEAGLPDIHESLVREYSKLIFHPAAPGQGGSA
jgi:hypothetical protein